MTSILTFLSPKAIANDWRRFVETGFKGLPDAVFTHVDSMDLAKRHLREKLPCIVVFDAMGFPDETYLSLAPHLHKRHVPVLISGDLHDARHIRDFESHAIKTLHLSVLDTHNFYRDADQFVRRYLQERAPRQLERM